MKEHVFNNREELVSCEYKSLERKLGLVVGAPYFNRGAGEHVCDMEVETVAVNTVSSVAWPRPGGINPQAVSSLKTVVAQIDAVIAELHGHKVRLQGDIEALESGEINLDEKARSLVE